MKNNDLQLIRRSLDGDDTAFAELVEKYKKQVHALVWRKIGDFHIAEEITQDTFLKAYQKLGMLKEPQCLASWLYVIAVNNCKAWLRKKHLRRQLLEDKDVAQSEKATYSEHVHQENERIIAETQRDVVKKLLAKLGESERTVMTLHYLGEMSCTEIGEFLGVSANTIKSRLRRAQQRLQKEEPIIREALDNFQISPNLTYNIIQEISRIKPVTPSSSKPFVPWAIVASTLAVVLLMLGFGNNRYLTRFQKPYSFDAIAEMTVEITDAPVVANLEPKPNLRTEIESANAQNRNNNSEQQPNHAEAANSEAQSEETMEDYTQWDLPKAAKARLGKGSIRAMQFSTDGTQLAIGNEIGVWLYDVNTGKEILLLPGGCESLAFSPDGRFLANSGDGSTTLWEVTTRQKVSLHDLLPAASVFWFSNDSKTLAILDKSGDTICWIDTDAGKSNVKKIDNRPDPNSRYKEVYALTRGKIAIADNNGLLELWNSKTGKKVSTLTGPAEMIQVFIPPAKRIKGGDLNRVISLAFSPDGARLASGRLDKTVRIWDTTVNEEPLLLQKQSIVSPTVIRTSPGLFEIPTLLEFSPDGKMIAIGENNSVKLWDTSTGESLDTFAGNINKVCKLTFSADGSTLAIAGEDGTVLYWNIKTGDPLQSHITKHTDRVISTGFLNNSSTLVSVDSSGIITLWDLETSGIKTHETKTSFENTRPLNETEPWVISPDGTKLLSRGLENNPSAPIGRTFLIRLIDVSTGRELNTLTYTNEIISQDITFSADGKMVAFGVQINKRGKIRLWNIETDKTLDIPFADGDVRTLVMAFSPDGNRLVTGTIDGKVQMWDVETGVHLTTFFETNPPKSGQLENLTFSSDGSIIAVVNDKQIRLLGSSKQQHFKEVFAGPDVNWYAPMFSPDNAVLVLSVGSGEIQLLDVTTGNMLTTLDGHPASRYGSSFSPDGKTLVSAGHTILLWDWDEVLKSSDR